MTCNRKGVSSVTINGESYTVRGMGDISPASEKAEGVANWTGDPDFKYMKVIPSIKGLEISINKENSAKALIGLCDASVQVEMKDGKVWHLTGASQTGDGTYNAEEGTLTLDFEGKKMAEL